jgi:hypothetical protein
MQNRNGTISRSPQMKSPAKRKAQPSRRSGRRVAAERGAQSVTRSADVRPHVEFLKQFQGSLPEIITESDLETLNLGLGHLFVWLREARQQYNEDQDGGRIAAFTTLGALMQFIMLFNLPLAEYLHTPILKLLDALVGLDQNNVLPILKPVARSGRSASNPAHAALKGHVAGTVMRLRNSGLDPKTACKRVATELAKLGIRPQRGTKAISANTVRHWCDDVASDVGRGGIAAITYDSMFTDKENERLHALLPANAQSFALASLRQYVQQIFPRRRPTASKPS